MLAGPPAANTRRIEAGTSTRRPPPSTMARRWATAERGAASRVSAGPTNRRRVSTWLASIFGHDDVGRLDDRVGDVALTQPHVVHGLDRDRCRHHRAAAHVDLPVDRRLPRRQL